MITKTLNNNIGATQKVKKRTKKSKRKINKIKLKFSDNSLTNYSGIIPISDFLFSKLNFIEEFEHNLNLANGKNIVFRDYQLLSSIIFGYHAGFRRLAQFEEFTKDKVMQKVLNLNKHIDENTFGNRLKKFDFKRSIQLSFLLNKFSKKVHNKIKFNANKMEIIDLDSTVKGVYGNQEGASKGYNHKKRGQKSYHPLLAFQVSSKECVHSWFRPGDTYTGNGIAEFIKECHEKLSHQGNIFLYRADSGFFSESFIGEVEAKSCKYLVKVKLKGLESLLTKEKWTNIPGLPTTEYCEFYHQCSNWKKSRKFVGIRILEEIIVDGVLFPQKVYKYLCFCSNLEEAPLEIYHQYKDRGECENWIESVKNQIGAGTALTNSFWANDVLWQLGVFAYNLTIWIRLLCCKKSWRQEPNTFRHWFIRIAGRMIKHAGELTLKLQKHYYYEKDWMTIYEKISCLQF